MKLLLEKSIEHLEAASRERTARNLQAARRRYLMSAECLFQAANQSKGRFRELRIQKAERILDIAQRLDDASHNQRKRTGEAVATEENGQSFLFGEATQVSLDDVAGLEEAKQEIRLRMIYPLEHPEKARRYGIRRGGGLLLYGPPGTGKTLLARAVAGEIHADFFTATPSQLMSKWVGEAEQNVARLFEQAHACDRAVIFLDEVEAMIPARRSSGSTVMQRVVPQILAELQGVRTQSGSLLFLGATNEPWAMDHAALRPGRFDAKVYVGLPDYAARRRMLDLYLTPRPLAPDVDLDQVTETLDGFSGADIAEICERCAAHVFVASIRDGIERNITAADFHKVLLSVKPSVSERELRKYETWYANT